MRIFYSPNINKLITLYLMENDYDLSLNRIDYIINSRPDILEDLLSIIHLVLEHKKSFTILGREAIPHDKKFYLRTSLKDIVSHLNSNPEDDDLKSIAGYKSQNLFECTRRCFCFTHFSAPPVREECISL